MKHDQRNAGHIYLELLAIVVLGCGISFFWRAWRSSDELIINESKACEILRAIASAQDEFREETKRTGLSRFGTFDELMGLGDNRSRYADIGNELRLFLETSDHKGHVFANSNYCFAVYLVDKLGFPIQEGQIKDSDVNPDFWIGYAWPRSYGSSGRRVFVMDYRGSLRAWNNESSTKTHYSGIEKPPPAHLALPEEGHSYPFAKKPQGTQRSYRWLME